MIFLLMFRRKIQKSAEKTYDFLLQG